MLGSRAPGWPAVLQSGTVCLRPIRRRDSHEMTLLRERNEDWLMPWEATWPRLGEEPPPSYAAFAGDLLRQARHGLALPWLIEFQGRLVGQMMITAVVRAAICSGSAGYWVALEAAGKGVAPTALALAFDHVIGLAGLHRLEVAIRPENRASLRVVSKLGFRDEGLRPRYLHVAGVWADHRVFALTQEDVPEGLLRRWRDRQGG